MSTTRTARFDELCNLAMVELEPVAPAERATRTTIRTGRASARVDVEDNGMGDLLRFDAERLRILVERHQLYTGSARARELLDDWDDALASFVKVMPTRLPRARCASCDAERAAATAAVAAE